MYWVHIMLYYPNVPENWAQQDELLRSLKQELTRLQVLRDYTRLQDIRESQETRLQGQESEEGMESEEGTESEEGMAIAHMRGRGCKGADGKVAQVPLQVLVASNSDKAFKNAMLQTVRAIKESSMDMALTVRHEDLEHTEASSRALGLITEMIAEDRMDPIPVWRFRRGDDGAWLA